MNSAAAVLFDFDGTLADTAADLGHALNRLRAEAGLAPLAVEAVRPYASMGARGMLRVGFSLSPADERYESLRARFLEYYQANMCGETRLFPGIGELLQALAGRGIGWGIVTNKARRFAERIVEFLELAPRCIVAGDDTPHLKPHPAPMLLAAERLALAPAACWYLGDDLRDVQAARAAGMRPAAVEWGYISPDNGGPRAWNADAVLREPLDLLRLL